MNIILNQTQILEKQTKKIDALENKVNFGFG